MGTNSTPTISVIIPVFRDWDRLALCLKALEKQSIPSSLFEIIIVNNDASHCLPEYSLPHNCVIEHEMQPGSYAARNQGISVARGSIFAFTDSDCIPHPNWLEAALDCFDNHPEWSRIGGAIELFFKDSASPTPSEMYETLVAFPQKSKVESGCAVTANMIAKKFVFERVGLFNSNLRSSGDSEWGNRANTAGFNIGYGPKVVVKHPARNKVSELVNKTRRIQGGIWQVSGHSIKSVNTWIEARGLFRPPVWTFLEFWKKCSVFGLRNRIHVTFVAMIVHYAFWLEYWRLLLGWKPRR